MPTTFHYYKTLNLMNRNSETSSEDDSPRGESHLLVNLDEILELELEDRMIPAELGELADSGADSTIDFQNYLRTLIRLQMQLIELQDWVVKTNYKLIVIFEGRDAAGKGSIIKRITQRLNPRVCRVVALPAPSEREKFQWYFQRYVSHLPAGGEISV